MPRRGAVVSSMSRQEIEDFYELKSLLEGYSARVAAEKITSRDIEKLKKINVNLEKAADSGDNELFFKLNQEFHGVFLSLCGNEKMREIRDSMVQRFLRFRLQALAVPGRKMESVKQHRAIIRAFEEGHGRLAEAIVVEHALHGGEELAEQVEKSNVGEKSGSD
jgi:DNA-binding GntR family transcriptional regulator